MHHHFIGWGKFYLAVEVIWALVWFAFEIWFNVTEGARPYEQALFDNIVRLVGVLVIMKMIRALKDKWTDVSYLNVTVVFIVGCVMARQTMVLFQSPFYVLGTNTVTNVEKSVPFWSALAAIVLSGLVLSFLELLWIAAAYHYLTWGHHTHGPLYWLQQCIGGGGRWTIKYERCPEKSHHGNGHTHTGHDEYNMSLFDDVLRGTESANDRIRSTPAPNISVRGLKK
jgi:hypothetical protein